MRHALGEAELAAGNAAGAERTYRDDLTIYPENGWSLFGLAAALRAQGKNDEASAVDARFKAAWTHADFQLDGDAPLAGCWESLVTVQLVRNHLDERSAAAVGWVVA